MKPKCRKYMTEDCERWVNCPNKKTNTCQCAPILGLRLEVTADHTPAWYEDPDECNKVLEHLVSVTPDQDECRVALDKALDDIWNRLSERGKP